MWVSALIVVLVGLLGTFLAVLFWGGAEKFIVQLFGLEEWQKYEALKFLGIGMGGVLLALQAVIANKRAKAMGDAADAQASAADAQARATEEQATANKNTEQGQRQERLKNAIEHLGHSSDSVRLGGAYELFHLAEDEDTAKDKKDTKDLRQTALDILCAHIRRTTSEEKYRAKHKSKPSEEIQSLLTLLFVQEHKVFTGRDIKINLQGSCLNGSNLRQARLEKAYLEGAQLHGAHLGGAQLHGAHLEGAQLHGAHLEGAQLHGTHLVGAQLQGASSDLRYFKQSFEASIDKRIDKKSELFGVIFAGGLTQKAVDCMCNGLSDGAANELRERLEAHIGKPESHELPKNSGASIGAYTEEEADRWIAEYKTAVPGGG